MLFASNIAQNSCATTTTGIYYSVRDSIGYKRASIIEQLEQVSHVNCLLECGRVEGCKHIAFNDKMNRCDLLKKVVEAVEGQSIAKSSDGLKIYSLGE